MIDYKDEIVDIFDQILNKEEVVMAREDIRENIEVPPSYEMGDYAFPVFALAKIYRKAPKDIAEELAGQVDSKYFDQVQASNAYVNFFTDKEELSRMVLGEIREKGQDYGRSDIGKGHSICLDYSSPNIAKPFHIGHLRSTVIGDSLERIYDFLSYDTYSYNHLGDYGTQFGMLITAIKRYNVSKDQIEEDPIPNLLDLYVRINNEAEEDEDLMDQCRTAFSQLENGNEEYLAMWEWIKEVSLAEFKKVYKMLDIDFYKYQGESFYTDLMEDQIKVLEEKDLLVDEGGAKAVDLEKYDLPNPVVIKSDGSSMYMTRDLATANYRQEEHDPLRSIYVVASEQNLYFRQLKAVLKEMGYDWYNNIVHVNFGMVSLPEGSLSTRKGRVVYLEDVLKQAASKVMDILKQREEEKGQEIENKEELAKEVGVGAIKFQELFNQRIKDYVFDWDTILSFEGETGPYVQYSHARICSLLEKGDFDLGDDYYPELLKTEEEINLLRTLYKFTPTVIEAHYRYEPYLVTRYVIGLAQDFNKYYNSTHIIGGDKDLQNTRLMLAYGVKTVIKQGLALLGIGAPEKM